MWCIIKDVLVPVACVFLGWLLGMISEHWAETRRSRERIAKAIRGVREELSKRSDNLDSAFVDWHYHSIRLLTPYVDYLQITQPKKWARIEPTLNEYSLAGQEKSVSTFFAQRINRAKLERKLNDLLKAVMDS